MEAWVLREPSRGLPLCLVTFLMAYHFAEVSPAVGPGRGSEGRQPGTETQPELLAWGPQGITEHIFPNLGGQGSLGSPNSLWERGTETWAWGTFALWVSSDDFSF